MKHKVALMFISNSMLSTKMINRYLGYYQIIGITVAMIIISVVAMIEGRMMIFYIPFAGILFLPFIIIASASFLDVDKSRDIIQHRIIMATFLLLAPSYFLPFFYEWGGWLIASICTGIGIFVWVKRKKIEYQLAILNVVGSAVLTLILIYLVISGIRGSI